MGVENADPSYHDWKQHQLEPCHDTCENDPKSLEPWPIRCATHAQRLLCHWNGNSLVQQQWVGSRLWKQNIQFWKCHKQSVLRRQGHLEIVAVTLTCRGPHCGSENLLRNHGKMTTALLHRGVKKHRNEREKKFKYRGNEHEGTLWQRRSCPWENASKMSISCECGSSVAWKRISMVCMPKKLSPTVIWHKRFFFQKEKFQKLTTIHWTNLHCGHNTQGGMNKCFTEAQPQRTFTQANSWNTEGNPKDMKVIWFSKQCSTWCMSSIWQHWWKFQVQLMWTVWQNFKKIPLFMFHNGKKITIFSAKAKGLHHQQKKDCQMFNGSEEISMQKGKKIE